MGACSKIWEKDFKTEFKTRWYKIFCGRSCYYSFGRNKDNDSGTGAKCFWKEKGSGEEEGCYEEEGDDKKNNQKEEDIIEAAVRWLFNYSICKDCVIYNMKARDVIKLLEREGWYLSRQKGSHKQYKHPVKKGLVTVAVHKMSDDIATGTLNSIFKQAQIRKK